MLSESSSVLYLLLGSTPVRTISHVFTKQNGASVLRKTFCSLRAALRLLNTPVYWKVQQYTLSCWDKYALAGGESHARSMTGWC
jgi:hypothetical protein